MLTYMRKKNVLWLANKTIYYFNIGLDLHGKTFNYTFSIKIIRMISKVD